MSAEVHILVEFKDGKPNLTLGSSYTQKTRAFQVRGAAENYAEGIQQTIIRQNEYWREYVEARRETDPPANIARWEHYIKPVPDIRILSVSIPDAGAVGDGLYPSLIGVPAVSWS